MAGAIDTRSETRRRKRRLAEAPWGLMALAACAVSAGSLLACSLFLSLDGVQCATDGDCTAAAPTHSRLVCASGVCQAPGGNAGPPGADARALVTDPAWLCLNDTPEAPRPGKPVMTTSIVFDSSANQVPSPALPGLAGVAVRACKKLDQNCATPISATVISDAKGIVTMAIPLDLGIYFELRKDTSDANGPAIEPTIVQSSNSVASNDITNPYYLPALPKGTVVPIATALSYTVDPSLGLVFGYATTCKSHIAAASGIAFALDRTNANTHAFYLRGGVPVAQADGGIVTDVNGVGGFINVPLGNVEMTSFDVNLNLQTSTTSIITRANWISFGYLLPSNVH